VKNNDQSAEYRDVKMYQFRNRELNGSEAWRLALLFLMLVLVFALAGFKVVHGQGQVGRFRRVEYIPEPAGNNSGAGRLLLSFDRAVETKLIREGSIPLFYMDVLGAKVDVNPFIINFIQGPVKLVRLNQISEEPPVLRATFFMKRNYLPTAKQTANGVELSFAEDIETKEKRSSYTLIAPPAETPESSVSKNTKLVPAKNLYLPGLRSADEAGVLYSEAGENLRIKVTDAEACNLMSELARQMNKTIYFRDIFAGRINVDIAASDAMQALQQIAALAGAQVTSEDGEIWVSRIHNPLLRISDKDTVEGADLSSLALGDVLRALGQIGEMNVALDSSLDSIKESRVDIYLQKSSVRRAFETLMKIHQLTVKLIDDKTLMVMTLEKSRRLEGKVIRVVSVDISFDKIKTLLEKTLSTEISGRVSLHEDLGNFIVTGDREAVELVVGMVKGAENKLLSAGSSLHREYFQPLNTKPEELINTVKESLGETENVRVIHDKRTDMILVTGPRNSVERAMTIFRRLDLEPTRQALIHIKLIEISRSDLDNMGISFPEQLAAVDNIGDLKAVSVVIPATFKGFSENSRIKTLANPTIRCMDKEEATIEISEQIPVKNTVTEYLPIASASLAARTSDNWTTSEVGIKLNIKPTIHKDNQISMQVDVDLTELLSLVEGHPRTARRVIKTMVRVEDKETVVIGGLIRTKSNKTRNPVPLLSKIPILKRLLRRIESRDNAEEKGEMVILITPALVGPADMDSDKVDAAAIPLKQSGKHARN
jgi:type II secretory pathway component GspD/PulD (secretin)